MAFVQILNHKNLSVSTFAQNFDPLKTNDSTFIVAVLYNQKKQTSLDTLFSICIL